MWVIQTTYCAGIYISSAAVTELEGKFQISKKYYSTYEEACEAFKTLLEKAQYKVAIDKIYPNRLYRLYSKKVYVVLYNSKKVGFFKMSDVGEIMRQNRNNLCYLKKKFRLDYEEAVAMVTALGAITGSDKILMRKNPVCGKLYHRQKEM